MATWADNERRRCELSSLNVSFSYSDCVHIRNNAFISQNWEFQIYDNRRVNSYTKNGVLYIKPTLTNDFYGENFVESGTLSMLGGSPADE